MSLLSFIVICHHGSLLLCGTLFDEPLHLFILSPFVLHNHLKESSRLLRIIIACLNLFGTYNFDFLLTKKIKHWNFRCSEQELGVCVINVNC